MTEKTMKDYEIILRMIKKDTTKKMYPVIEPNGQQIIIRRLINNEVF